MLPKINLWITGSRFAKLNLAKYTTREKKKNSTIIVLRAKIINYY